MNFWNRGGQDGTAPSSGGKDQSLRELKDLFRKLRTEIDEDVRGQVQSLATRTDRSVQDVLDAVHGIDVRLDVVSRNVEAMAQNVGLLLDTLRNQGVREAIDEGRATSNTHHRHLELAKVYDRLVRQDLRQLVRLLCPQQSNEGEADLARRRADVVSKLVVSLFQPLDQPMYLEQEHFVAERRELGLAADTAQSRGLFDSVSRKAAELRDGVACLPFTAHLDFSIDIAALPADHYTAWDQRWADGGHPEFLIAPAYMVGGDRPRNLTKPIVFVTPSVGS
ncbi:hypothetical protein [Streptomyces platensis]|uniref:hypothetical protein n=1 Tax=Streptomyces platensis TaxID=58346 RepID=UPI0036C9AB92